MGKISDEIREFVRRSYADEHMDPRELLAIADRADRELVELPRDRDGVPINLGDTVYLDDGRKAEVSHIDIMPTKNCIVCLTSDKKNGWYPTSAFTHTCPDSFERIADELDKWCDGADIYGDACVTPRELADRIRKLAKEGEHGR